MPHYSPNRCTRCGETTDKSQLVAVTVTFSPVGERRILRSRVTDWLCNECLQSDKVYKSEPFTSPGMKSEGLEKVRSLRGEAAK